MASNRIYPAEVCANPACELTFLPHDRRQIFCSEQCRTNYYNDKKHEENNERYHREKYLRECDGKLEILESSAFYNAEQITQDVLDGCEIDYSGIVPELHLDTKNPVWWFHAYGVELIDIENGIYVIHKRTHF